MLISEKLSTAADECVSACKTALEASYERAVQKLAPGERTPQKNVFHTTEDLDNYLEHGERMKRRALDIVAGSVLQSRRTISAAPTAAAASYIEMLAARKEIEPMEFTFALEHYGDNYNAASRIIEIAAKHGHTLTINDATLKKAVAQSELYKSLSSVLDPRTLYNNISSNPNYYAWYFMQVKPKFAAFD